MRGKQCRTVRFKFSSEINKLIGLKHNNILHNRYREIGFARQYNLIDINKLLFICLMGEAR